MEWVYDDGGRSQYFKAEKVGDCACRAIAIATGMDYKRVYDDLNRVAKTEKLTKRHHGKSSARNGMHTVTVKRLLEGEYGWEWHPTMGIGTGCRVHVREDELPSGRLVLNLSRHFACVVDGVLHDTYDCSREGTRCVYGYWTAPKPEPKPEPTITSIEFMEWVDCVAEDFVAGLMSAEEFGQQCEAVAHKLRGK